MTSSELRELETFIKEIALTGYDINTELITRYDTTGTYDRTTIIFRKEPYSLLHVECREDGYEIFPHIPGKIEETDTFDSMLECVGERIKAYDP